MAAISNEKLNDAITEFLKDADLKTVTAKKVRGQLEAKFKTSLLSRKKEIEEMIMKIISDSQDGSNNDDEDEDDDEEEEDEKPAAKNKKPAAGKGTDEALARQLQDEEDDDDMPSRTRGSAKGGRKPAQKRKKGGGDDDDEAKPKKKNTGFTKEMRLSPLLAEVMGQEKMARHEVVKKMWAVIADRDLKDPKDKRFTICDDQLHTLFGVKRFRTFSMLKYLTKHLMSPD